MKPATLNTVTAAPSGYLFEIVGLEKTFEDGRVQALRSVTFGAVQEEFVAITGPSGCGKTAAPNAGRALKWPTAGTLLYRGNSILNLPDPSIYRLHFPSISPAAHVYGARECANSDETRYFNHKYLICTCYTYRNNAVSLGIHHELHRNSRPTRQRPRFVTLNQNRD